MFISSHSFILPRHLSDCFSSIISPKSRRAVGAKKKWATVPAAPHRYQIPAEEDVRRNDDDDCEEVIEK